MKHIPIPDKVHSMTRRVIIIGTDAYNDYGLQTPWVFGAGLRIRLSTDCCCPDRLSTLIGLNCNGPTMPTCKAKIYRWTSSFVQH